MKHVICSVVFLFLCSSSTYCFWAHRNAVKAYRAGEYSTALEQFEALLTESPDDAQLNYNAGKAAYMQQEYAAAAAYFSQAVKQPDNTDAFAVQAWFDLGNAQVKQKNWQEALKSYEKVLMFDSEHKEAKDMIDKIKKLLEEQEKKQENNQQNDKQNNQQNNQEQENNTSEDQGESQQDQKQQDNQQQQDDQESNNGQSDTSQDSKRQKSERNAKKQDGQDQSDQKDQQSDTSDELNQEPQERESSKKGGEKQNLDKQNAKQGGEEKGEESQGDKEREDLKQDRGEALEDSIPDIQDHERKDNSFDHSASPTTDQSNSSKQDTPVAAKAQAKKIDPFSYNDDIDKNSREGKVLQFIETRDAQAAQQLLKMNVQTQRKPGEKNW